MTEGEPGVRRLTGTAAEGGDDAGSGALVTVATPRRDTAMRIAAKRRHRTRGARHLQQRRVAATAPLAHEALENHPFPEWPRPDLYRGMDGPTRLVEEWTENFDNYRWDA